MYVYLYASTLSNCHVLGLQKVKFLPITPPTASQLQVELNHELQLASQLAYAALTRVH